MPLGDPLRVVTRMAAPDCLEWAGSSGHGGLALPHTEAVCGSTAHETGSGGSLGLGRTPSPHWLCPSEDTSGHVLP